MAVVSKVLGSFPNRDLPHDTAEAALQSAKAKPSGVLKVTVPADLGHALLPRIARTYTAKYPDVSLELILTNRIVDLVEESIDLAIRWSGSRKELVARRFIETSSNLWASPKYIKALGKATHPHDLANATCLARLRLDPQGDATAFEPGMTVWVSRW